jgi:hypothetical protein
MNTHEELFVKNFVVKQKRERYLEFLAKEKTRDKITWDFRHCGDLEEKYKTQVPVNQQNAKDVYKILKEKNAPDKCYILSYHDEVDGKEMSLKKVLEETIFYIPFTHTGTFISCIAGKLVFYSSEDLNGRFILEKND